MECDGTNYPELKQKIETLIHMLKYFFISKVMVKLLVVCLGVKTNILYCWNHIFWFKLKEFLSISSVSTQPVS